MTLQELIDFVGSLPFWVLLVAMACPVVLAWLMGRLLSRTQREQVAWRRAYSVLVYFVCVPGMFATALSGYALFFTQQDLRSVHVGVYFLPILTMILTLVFIGRKVAWRRLPGVDRLYGLMIVMGLSFMVALFLHRMRFWILFGGGMLGLIFAAVVVFFLLRWGSAKLLR